MKIPHFIPNEPDGVHCMTACYRMALETLTGEVLTNAQAEAETSFVPGKGTWPCGALLNLARRGLEVEQLGGVPFRELAKDPQKVCLGFFGAQMGAWVVSHTNWNEEMPRLEACLSHPHIKMTERPATVKDLLGALETGKVVIPLVNSCVLKGKEGYSGHYVIVEEFGDGAYVLQNPQFDPVPHQRVPKELFEKAWFFPSPKMAALMTIAKE